MPRRSRRYQRTASARLGGRIRGRRERRWPPRSNAPPYRRLWQIPHRAPQSKRHRKHRRLVLFHLAQHPGIRAVAGRRATIRVLGAGHCCVGLLAICLAGLEAHELFVFVFVQGDGVGHRGITQVLRDPDEFSRAYRVLGLRLRRHYPHRALRFPGEQCRRIRYLTVEPAATAAYGDRSTRSWDRVCGAHRAVHGPGVVRRAHRKIDGGYWV